MSSRVMVVEDDHDVLEFVGDLLESEGFEVKLLSTGDDLSDKIREFTPDILIVDQFLPNVKGVDLIKSIRTESSLDDLLIMMLTGFNQEELSIQAFNSGADEFVLKPIQPRLLSCRLRALLRRKSRVHRTQKLKKNGVVLDPVRHEVTIDNEKIFLTLTEIKILNELMKEGGAVVARETLCQSALGKEFVSVRTIDVHVNSLRKKLTSHSDLIETVRGVGYKIVS